MDIVNEITTHIKTDIVSLKSKLQTFSSSSRKIASYKKAKIDESSYRNLSHDYTKEYTSSNFVQYSHLYFLRLNEIKNDLVKLAQKKWPSGKICKNMLDVKGKVIFKFTALGGTDNNWGHI
jgi:hypothetical protein